MPLSSARSFATLSAASAASASLELLEEEPRSKVLELMAESHGVQPT